ncbi:MAG: DNA-binding winged helix-turn-helix (wHTH) protein [Flavobacteriales bacterium]|jgi:DNA-binding winged helix-turn-helix (wHTH) protein
MTYTRNQNFNLQGIIVCADQNTLSYDRKTIKLQPKVMEVLCYLAQNSDRVVSIDELIAALWGGAVVSNHAVQRCISNIRKHLTKLLGEGDYVISYSKKGYQLSLPQRPQPDESKHIAPSFTSSMDSSTDTVPHNLSTTGALSTNTEIASTQIVDSYHRAKWILGFILACVILSLITLSVYTVLNRSSDGVHPMFESLEPLTSEAGLEYYPEPHPNSQYFAFGKYRNTHYELWIKDLMGEEWRIDQAQGKWDLMAWSPDGVSLIASAANFTNDGTSIDVYLYELDLTGHQVIKKTLLFPWKGDLFSITWASNDVLELTGRYGVRGELTHFKYRISTEDLNVAESTDMSKSPHIIDITDGRVALASYQGKGMVVDLYDTKGRLATSRQFEVSWLDVSWKPDGSGVLLLMNQKLYSLGLKGALRSIPFITDKTIHRPRYSRDGESIFVTLMSENSDIWLESKLGAAEQLTGHPYNDSLAQFDQAGERIFYLSKRAGTVQLYVLQDGEHSLVTKSVDEQDIVYFVLSEDQQTLLYKTTKGIYSYTISEAAHSILIEQPEDIYPVEYLSEQGLIFYSNRESENTNIWKMDVHTKAKKQITFGTVYFAIAINGDLYFQYFKQKGLYRLRNSEKIPTIVTNNLPANSIFTLVNTEGVYYMSMEFQQQSNNYYLDFATQESVVFSMRDKPLGLATSFHPDMGVLISLDAKQDGDIFRMK